MSKVLLKFQIDLKQIAALTGIYLMAFGLLAQSFEIGHTSMVFHDNSRNRDIITEIYYPANNSGDDEPISMGEFPMLIFGHGFLMSWDAYENFWTEVVPNGYIICFPTTEMGLSPDHQEFGFDLKFLATQMQVEAQNSTSLFYNSIAAETGLMGHSMGGGAALLAAENNPNIHTFINFAAAETSPSAISAASSITVPSLIFSGDADCVAPPEDHQNLMYDHLSSNCKTQIKIIGGGHCYFANDNFNCNLGESLCNGNPTISRLEQQSVTNDFLNLWLDYALKGSQNALTIFNDSLQTSNRINHLQTCNAVGVSDINLPIEMDVFPNPTTGKLNIHVPIDDLNGTVTISNVVGQQIYQSILLIPNTPIDLTKYPNGSYFVSYTLDSVVQHRKIIKQH